MSLKPILTFLCLTLSCCLWAQEEVTISGYLTDASNGESLLYGNVYLKNTSIGNTTNEYGFYSIDVPKGEAVILVYSYLGYTSKEVEVKEQTSKQINIKINQESEVLGEVEIIASKVSSEKEAIKSTQTSTIHLPIKEIKTIPSLGGEVDIIKVVQLMPGISKGGEGGTGMFVRGGDADQNLVLLDEAVVYNLGHLFGFFSVFNPDALHDLSIIKGGFPAQYGGRLSSVLDVRMKEGNNQKLGVQGGIGLLSSRLTIEAPILKDKASFLLSGRRTYIDRIFKVAKQTLPYYFYDVNAKFNYILSDKDRIFLSVYAGDDVLKFDENDIEGGDIEINDNEEDLNFDFGFQLGNVTQTLRWNHIYNPKLFSNLSFIHTSFNYDITGAVLGNSIVVKSEIRDLGVKLDFANYQSATSKLRFGAASTLHRFRPNILNTKGDISEVIDNRAGVLRSVLESTLYGNYDFEVKESLKINAGLRLSGTGVENKFYAAIEPRFSANYAFNDNQSFKFSYSRMVQYMHRVSSSTIALPTDLWYPVSENVKPQSSHQVALSYNYFLDKPQLSFTIEGYYKTMKNLIEYKEGSNLILNDNFEEFLTQGTGKSWGAELLLRRQSGKFTGWLGYTLAWSRRQFDAINNGKAFWAKYDRRHILSVVTNLEISKRIIFSAVWEYTSGARFTPVQTQYLFPNAGLTNIEIIPVYSKRNEFKLSSSHRLDINFVIKNKPHKRFRSEWHLGGYNVYNRATPYSIRVRLDPTTGQLKYEQPGLFGFIPSIAYNFSF